MPKDDSYHYVRYRWGTGLDLEKFRKELGTRFTIGKVSIPEVKKDDVSVYRTVRGYFEVKADTLSAFLSANKVVLSQKEKAPFTRQDLELRKAIFQLYPHSRPTPFPWQFSGEPSFEIKQNSVNDSSL